MVVLGERHLHRILAAYFAYYHGSRTHLSLAKDAPTPRRVQGVTEGDVIAFRKSAACTTVMNDAPLDLTSSALSTRWHSSGRHVARFERFEDAASHTRHAAIGV
jgi:hypothetical protein